MQNKKQNNFKYENINPNKKADFQKCYKDAINLIGQLRNTLQQLAASHKAIADKNNGGQ